jgi:ABC-type multidrug transport system ATPase subunit
MITDEISPTLGSRLFNNMTMKEFLEDNIIGYCPQFDAVDELLTGNEALHIYSKLIGLTDINTAILTAITRFKLQSFIDVPIIKYSGGMKRTLSVAVAMLGNPQIVLLDEPTNGMDPEMRRRVWDNILKLIKEERSVLLTSHSMAECDALCSRLAIMVNGQFMCLGTTQHLKHRFGGGYTLQIKVSKDSAINLVIEFIEAKFLNCILKDKHGNKLEYIIPHKGNSLGKIFGVMESNKFGYSIADYSVSQTTLDQVFINFAKSKRERGNSDEDDDEDDEEDDESVTEDENEMNNKLENENTNQIRVNLPTPIDKNETSRFDSIKNHFNSLKKSKHIRKTSSAKSQHRRQSTRSRKSIRNSISNGDAGFTNLAYEIEFKNSDACEFPMQESAQDTTNSFNEDGEYFSKC